MNAVPVSDHSQMFQGASRLDRSSSTAFTLVEMLIASAVTAIVLLTLLQLFSQSMTAWNGEIKRESSLSELRSGLRLLTDDLQSLHPLPSYHSTSSSAATPQPPDQETSEVNRFILVAPQHPLHSSSFAFLRIPSSQSYAPSTSENGDLRLVAYAAALSNDPGGGVSQKLWRREFTGTETLARIKNHFLHQTPLIQDSDWEGFVDPHTGFIKQSPGDLGEKAEPVIYDLIQCLVTPLKSIASSSGSVELQTASLPWPSSQIPSHVRITVRVTNRATASLLRSRLDWIGDGEHAHLIHGSGLTTQDFRDDPEVHTHSTLLRIPTSSIDIGP